MNGKNQIIYHPNSFKMGDYPYARITDADTPYIESSIRMLSIDAPEVHYPAKQTTDYDGVLELLGKKLETREAYPEMDEGLRLYLIPRLKNNPGTRQYIKGLMAADQFQKILHNHLYPPNRHSRKLLLIGSGDRFDSHGRILSYITPSYTQTELKKYPRSKRKTFNLLLVENGWAASFPIFPSLPNTEDMERLREGAEKARAEKKGFWEDESILLGYEFRMCVRLASGKPLDECVYRYCVDMTSKQLYPPQEYYKADPENRIFIDSEDLDKAKKDLGLIETDRPVVIRDNPMYGANPFPQSNTLYAAWADPSDGTVVAVGECGTIYQLDKSQLDSHQLNTPLQVNHKVDFYDVFGFSKKNIWAVGTFGQVWHSDGKSWQYQDTLIPSGFKEPVWLEAIWGRTPEDIYIAGDESAVYHYDGTQWQDIAKPPKGAKRNKTHLYSLGGLEDGTLYAIGSFGNILKITPPNSETDSYTLKWYHTGVSETLNAIQRIPGTRKFLVCGTGGTLFWWEKDKATPIQHGLKDDFYAIDAPAKDKIMVVGRKGRAIYFNGKGWMNFHLGINTLLEGVVHAGENRYLAVGWFGKIACYDASSGKWATLQAGMAETVLSVKIHPEGNILAVTESGNLLYSLKSDSPKKFKTCYAPPLDIREIIPLEGGNYLLTGPDGYSALFQVQNSNPVLVPLHDNSLQLKRNQTQVFAESRYRYIFGENFQWYGLEQALLYDLAKDPEKQIPLNLESALLSANERLVSGGYCSQTGRVILGGSRGSLILLEPDGSNWNIKSYLSGAFRAVMALDIHHNRVVAGFSGGSIVEYALTDFKPVLSGGITAPALNSVASFSKGFVYCGENGIIGLLTKTDYSSKDKVRVLMSKTETLQDNPDLLVSCGLNDQWVACGGVGCFVLVKEGKVKTVHTLDKKIITSMNKVNDILLAGTSLGEILSWKIPDLLAGAPVPNNLAHPFKDPFPVVGIIPVSNKVYIIGEDASVFELFSLEVVQKPIRGIRITSPLASSSRGIFYLGGSKTLYEGVTSREVHYFGMIDLSSADKSLKEISIPDNTFSETSLYGVSGTGDCWVGGFSGTLLLWSNLHWYKIHLGIGNHLLSLAEKDDYVVITGKQGALRFEKISYIQKGIKS